MKFKILLRFLCALAVVCLAGSCRARTDRSSGTVILTFGNITGIPTIVSVGQTDSGAGQVDIGTFILENFPKDPNGTTSNLQDVELTRYQVTYTRHDTGTRVPPPLIAAFTLEVPINGSGTITNLPIVALNQLLSPPLSDLRNFGFDQETGTAVIVVDAAIQFFGQTISGDSVASPVAVYTLEFTP